MCAELFELLTKNSNIFRSKYKSSLMLWHIWFFVFFFFRKIMNVISNGTIWKFKWKRCLKFWIYYIVSPRRKKWQTKHRSHTNSDRFYAALLQIYFIGVLFIAKLLEVDSRIVVGSFFVRIKSTRCECFWPETVTHT